MTETETGVWAVMEQKTGLRVPARLVRSCTLRNEHEIRCPIRIFKRTAYNGRLF